MPGRPSITARRTCSTVGVDVAQVLAPRRRATGRPGRDARGTRRTSAPTGSAGAGRRCLRRLRSPPRSRPGRAGAGAGRRARPRAYPSPWMDGADKQLCDLIQNEFPVTERPYAALGETARDVRGRGARAGHAPARRADHPPGLGDLRHAQARLHVDAGGGAHRARAGRRGRRGDLEPPRRDPQLPARARVQHLVHAGRAADLAARPRPDGRAAGRAGRGRRRSGRCRRCASSRSASTST